MEGAPDGERREKPSRRTRGLAFAYLIAITGAVLILIPLTGLVRHDEPDPDKCVPSYSKCLDPGARDYDCEGEGDGPRYTTGPIVVTGDDPFRLDPDGDGFACT
jgi:hypothetical protein